MPVLISPILRLSRCKIPAGFDKLSTASRCTAAMQGSGCVWCALAKRQGCRPAGACNHAMGRLALAYADYDDAFGANLAAHAAQETLNFRATAYYQGEICVYFQKKLDADILHFSIDRDLDEEFKELWAKQHMPTKSLLNRRPRQVPAPCTVLLHCESAQAHCCVADMLSAHKLQAGGHRCLMSAAMTLCAS